RGQGPAGQPAPAVAGPAEPVVDYENPSGPARDYGPLTPSDRGTIPGVNAPVDEREFAPGLEQRAGMESNRGVTDLMERAVGAERLGDWTQDVVGRAPEGTGGIEYRGAASPNLLETVRTGLGQLTAPSDEQLQIDYNRAREAAANAPPATGLAAQ